MKFGIWDHVDRNQLALADQFDRRLDYLKAADEAGFYSFHVSEHHATPLNMVPVPGPFLGAVARETKRMRLGPLCYLLPLYSPLRLIEEICILDHLCRGRFDIGVGRGISPYELNFHNVNPENSCAIFEDALETILYGLTHERLDHEGPYFNYKDVPMELTPLQQPHPPIWYPSSNEAGSAWAGERGYHLVTLGGTEAARPRIDAYKEAYAKRGGPLTPNDDLDGGTAIGIMRHLVIGETEDEARTIADEAYVTWYDSLTKLQRANVNGPQIAGFAPPDMETARQAGGIIVGTVDSVRDEIASHIETLGLNYMIFGFYLGNIAHEHAIRSLQRFSEEIMPGLS